MPIYVSGIADMPMLVRQFDIQDLISIVAAESQPRTPPEVDTSNHHRCPVDDITEATPGKTAPKAKHIADVIEFLNNRDPESGLLVHCIAGVSRSTAVALVAHTLLTKDPSKSALVLREAAPYAWPNRLIVSLADSLLKLDGQLIRAREEMGPANWEIDPNYTVPRLHGSDARGYEPGRYAKLDS